MGRNRRRGWASRVVRVIASLAAICIGCAGGTTALPGERGASPTSIPGLDSPQWLHGASSPAPACPSGAHTPDHFVLMVSTLDGAVSALDMRDSGEMLWSVKPDERPLLSSSISNIQVTKDGIPTRLIPSLDGSLYEFNGEEVKAMPMTAESLLSSSLCLNDNYVMVGGKEVNSYGIDLETGQMVYRCTSDGCKETSEAGNGNGDMMVITRNLKTVRAIDVNSGGEKWNFSVGQHDLLFVESKKEKSSLEHRDGVEINDEDITLVNCTPSDDEVHRLEEEMLKQMIKVEVSNGRVVVLNPEDPSQMSWSRKFNSPVANVWVLHRGKLEVISLFDNKVVPALSSEGQPFQFHRSTRGDPLLYVGTHKKQVYVQTQETDSHSCEPDLPWTDNQKLDQANMARLPRVSWRPYMMASQFQTPLFGGNVAPDVPLVGMTGQAEEEEASDTSLTVWHENYPFDMGYYLYPSFIGKDQSGDGWKVPPEEDGILDILPASLWMWWKEVVAISLLTSLVMHIILTRFMHRHPPIPVSESNSQNLETKDSSGSLVSNESFPVLEQTPADFKSRFAEEFDCMEQLGRGGFGIVFRAKNKVDEQEYAVKRIALPNSDNGAIKKKMLREVRTLAMLDHIGIVRYFHSWIEDPPPGWQEERDKEIWDTMGSGDCFTPTADTTVASQDMTHASVSHIPFQQLKKPDQLVKRQRSLLDDIMPCAAGGFPDDNSLCAKGLTASGSGEFSVHSNVEEVTEESGSFSLNGDRSCAIDDYTESRDSCSVVFQNSDTESSISRDPAGGKLGVRGSSVELSNSGEGVLPFTCYKSVKSKRHGVRTSSKPEDEEDSVVFEASSGSRSKTRLRDCSVSSDKSMSVVFGDSSYGGSMGDNESGDHLPDILQPKFTLSSHGYSEQFKNEEQQVEKRKKDKSEKDKQPVPKLYLYLQMQLCRLETLKDWLMANTLNRERVVILDIFEQIVSAVDYVHSKGLIHRDLKPSNIFFALDGIVKVGDFGLVTAAENQAELESTEQSSDKRASAKHTAEVGTQLYMSPEQVQKKSYDQKVDVFSLGLIFLELLMPFSTGMERVSTLQNARKGIFPERFCRELPMESDLVRQLTSSNPQKRPTTQQILEHSLLKDFSPRRLSFRSRSRTISSSSAQSQSEPVLPSEKEIVQPSR